MSNATGRCSMETNEPEVRLCTWITRNGNLRQEGAPQPAHIGRLQQRSEAGVDRQAEVVADQDQELIKRSVMRWTERDAVRDVVGPVFANRFDMRSLYELGAQTAESATIPVSA
jgi:hypothetical protein